MVALNKSLLGLANASESDETLLARLTETAYTVALRHGITGSFADLQLALWYELRRTLRANEPRAASEQWLG